jgi:TPR repeat protein
VLAERSTLSLRQTFCCRVKAWLGAAALALVLLALPSAMLARANEPRVTFVSPDAALEQGINAYRGGYVEFAIPALRYAAEQNEFLAQYLLAAILADNSGAHTNHGEAFRLLRQIVFNNANVDPDDDPRAPYVSKALLSFGEYLNRGVPELNMAANPAMALRYIEHAAKFFGNRDAQFTLAKMLIAGEGGRKDVGLALHFLSTLVQGGHAGAQAFLADQYWRGQIVDKDDARALALAELAVRGAAPTDHLWVDDIYQNIYCGMNEPRRKEARPLVQRWGQFFDFGRAFRRPDQDRVDIVPTRTCADGKPIPLLDDLRGPGSLQLPPGGELTASPAQPSVDQKSVRDVGAKGR